LLTVLGEQPARRASSFRLIRCPWSIKCFSAAPIRLRALFSRPSLPFFKSSGFQVRPVAFDLAVRTSIAFSVIG
jgi:hypothetical protein